LRETTEALIEATKEGSEGADSPDSLEEELVDVEELLEIALFISLFSTFPK
jgi:hypothetical protein